MCSVYKTVLYRKVKLYFTENLIKIKNNNSNLESFLIQALQFSCEFSLCSPKEHEKSNRLFRYYLTKFFTNKENKLEKLFFPRTKYYFGLSKRSIVNNIQKYHQLLMI